MLPRLIWLLWSRKSLVVACAMTLALACTGCGGPAGSGIAPIVLSVTLNTNPVQLAQSSTDELSVVIDAPTETATLQIVGLPAGVTYSYKESESNPSGQLTLTASSIATLGKTTPTITVGSSGQTASTVFTLEVTAPAK